MENKSYDAMVGYGDLDTFKREALAAARSTVANARNLESAGFKVVMESFGESVFLIEGPDCYLAFLLEGLGTKNLVAEVMQKLTGKSFAAEIAQDTLAMIANDLAVCGARPLLIGDHIAVGSSDWVANKEHRVNFCEGWRKSCELLGALWPGGETATLKGIVEPGTAMLGGGALGIIKPKNYRISFTPQEGDVIYLVSGSGIHANGLTAARELAQSEKLQKEGGYLAKRLLNGHTYGETLLEPTPLYGPLVDFLLRRDGIKINYAVNTTGHGWRKLMRAKTKEPLAYVINHAPMPNPIFNFIERHAGLNEKEMYNTFNMGAGFALYVPEGEVDYVEEGVAEFSKSSPQHFSILNAGRVQKPDKEFAAGVHIRPRKIYLPPESLNIR